jgi:hypothetical protein
MRIMDIPPFRRAVDISDVASFLRTRLNGETVMFPEQAIALLSYMCCPEDPSGRDRLMRILRSWAKGSQEVPPRLGRIQHEWLRVADVLHHCYDLAQGHHQERRGGASTGKAVTLVDANAKSWGTSEANLWKLWSKYKDVAHLVTAAVFISADVKERHRRKPFSLRLHQLVPFQLVMFVPDLIIAVALEFQRFGLETFPFAQTEPMFNPESLWRIPEDINVSPLAPTARTIRPPDVEILNARRAGNRG